MQFVERAVPLHIVTIYERQKLRGLNQLVRHQTHVREIRTNTADLSRLWIKTQLL